MMPEVNQDSVALRAVLLANAERNGLPDARIHVARSGRGGWRVRVVHDELSGLPDDERRAKLLLGLHDEVEDAELLTTAEEKWYGPAFPDHDGPLPTWSESLGQSSTAPLLFASDLDEDVTAPAVVTFYSLRGGVGRTTALAAAARILSARGHRVLVRRHGLRGARSSLFVRLSEPSPPHGALPFLLALERGDDVDIRDHVQRVSEAEELYCLPAGRLGVDYAQRLRLIEPELWYRETPNPLHSLLDLAATSSIAPDIILMDARTGISPISAPLLFDVSDLAVVCFFPHPQASRGTELLVQSLLTARTRRSRPGRPISPEPRFLVCPVPPGPSATRVQIRAASWIDRWLGQVQDRRTSDVGPLQGDELSHLIAYSPETAFKDSLELTPATNETYGPVADWLEQLLAQPDGREAVRPGGKQGALREFDFSTGTAEHQESFFEDFVRTRVCVQAMDPRYPLVVGRKGTGKTAVFRWLLERPSGEPPVPVMCPHAFRNKFPWVLGADGFAAIERHIDGHDSGWPAFWSCYSALAAFLFLPASLGAPPPVRLGIETGELAQLRNQLDDLAVVDLVTKMMTLPEAGLLASRWLRDIDKGLTGSRFLLFDGLDTGFGNDGTSRGRRTSAVTGLFTFLTEMESRLQHLSFKVLLRFDIWQQLRFENKSHLFGRSVQLLWRDQADYFKTALKQAARSGTFKGMLAHVGIGKDIDLWRNEEVFRAWNLLVGERMKGGKTTFTRNWVWNRLADGLGDHGPRALSQLFSNAVEWEAREEERSGYDRSVIRPRALVPSLEKVSVEAIQALREEFPELAELIEALERIGRTPLDPGDVEGASVGALDQLDLALEVGLVAVHEGTQENVYRYRVPDLYRHALRMTRKGQA